MPPLTEEMRQILRSAITGEQIALYRRIWAEEPEAIVQWPHNDKVQDGYPPYLVQDHCVRNEDWQRVRLSMKSRPTHEKLAILKRWWDGQYKVAGCLPTGIERSALWTATIIQVGNYLGALRRGGQLDDQNRIRKYL